MSAWDEHDLILHLDEGMKFWFSMHSGQGLLGSRPNGIPAALREMDAPGLAKSDISSDTLMRWHAAFEAMARDAMEIGIPASAIPKIPLNPNEKDLRDARDHLNAIILSFMSSEL